METEAALGIEIIVEHIFNFLSVEDLKNARLVCQLWSCEGAKQILLKGYFRVPPRFHKEKSSKKIKEEKRFIFNFLHPQKLELKLRPLPNVWITQVKEIQVLFDLEVLSGNVKSLRFPPVVEFELERDPIFYGAQPTELHRWFKQLLSSHLTSLSAFYFTISFNLLYGHMSAFQIEQFIKLDKGHVIKAINFKVSCNKHLDTLEKLVATTPHLALESLIFGSGINYLRQNQPALFSLVVNVLNQLIASSATSLRKLQVTDTFGQVNELEIPILPNLTTLTVLLPCKNQNPRVFPENMGAELSLSFPNLSKVTIGILGNDWIGRRVFQEISTSDKEKLLPELNPELKFSVYEYRHDGNGKNQLLVSPQNVIPEELCVKSMSEQVDTSELDAEWERMYDNLRWWFHFGWIFLVCLGLLPLVLNICREVRLYRRAIKEHGEMTRQHREMHNMVEGKIPSTVCVGMEHTWKIPPIFACPKNIIDENENTTSSLSFLTWTLNLRQFTCQQATMYASTKFKALEDFKKGNGAISLDPGSNLHISLPYEINSQSLLIFPQHLESTPL